MISIDIKSLKPGIYTYDWDPTADSLDLDPEVFDELHVAVQLDFHPSRILAHLETTAEARLICDRTLVQFSQQVEGAHTILFSAEGLVEAGDESDDDVRELKSSDEEIDLTDLVRDTFVLSIPVRKIAPGAEEEEIPLAFGTPDAGEGAIDPRWEALRKLSSQEQDSAEDE